MTDKDLARMYQHTQGKTENDFARVKDVEGGGAVATVVSFDSISHTVVDDETITLVRATFADGTTHDFDIHTKNGGTLFDCELEQTDGYFNSKEAMPVGAHIHFLFELETTGSHAGADFVLHPYNGAVCNVCFRLLINGQFVDGFASLNEENKVHISFANVPETIINTVAHYTVM